MSTLSGSSAPDETDDSAGVGTVTVRYWAAARAAAGVESDRLAVAGPVSLAEVTQQVLTLHQDSRLHDVIGVCSVLVGDRPARTQDPAEVMVEPGTTVEFLPPFAGG
jgi:molybdopterin converting factor small subunit